VLDVALAIALVVSAFAAIVPTVAYCVAFYWADRYEREPLSLLLVAFVWGAIPAVFVSLIGELVLGSPFVSDVDSLQAALVQGVLVAPIIEETAKAAALVGLFFWKRNEFDGVLDGLVYGALVGFGFAMTENFLYFVGAYAEGGFASLSWVIVLRAIVFGLNHAFYTGMTSIGFGLARNARRPFSATAWIAAGLAAAIAIHALHNFGATIAGITPFGFLLSLFVAAGGLSLIAAAVLIAWRHERSVIRLELAEELGGILSSQELLHLTGRWHQPLRRRPHDDADRMALFVELAIRKRRLRILGADRSAGLISDIEDIRRRLREMSADHDSISS
jgi:protease PrsW